MSQNLMRTRSQIERQGRMLSMSEIASSLAHELNQPLGVISNYAGTCIELLKHGKIDHDELETALARITDQVMLAGEITRRLRRFVQHSEINPESITVSDLIEEVIEVLSLDFPVAKTAIVKSIEAEETMVVADRTQLTQVFYNLLRNALECSGGSKANIVISASTQDGTSQFSVCDQGSGIEPGMSPDELVDTFYSSKSSGLGMGLPIVRTIIESHGGKFWLESKSDSGTKAVVQLPAKRPQVFGNAAAVQE